MAKTARSAQIIKKAAAFFIELFSFFAGECLKLEG
jgi:hypothetical protein